MFEITKEVVKEISKDVYDDIISPVAKPTGTILGLIPRAIKAALSPLEKWILQKEYNISEIQRLLEEKLKNVSPELIGTPEPYIAVPAIQYISYCMDKHLLNKCETVNKNRRESNTEAKFRKALFSAFYK